MIYTRGLKLKINEELGERGSVLSLFREDKCDLVIKFEFNGQVKTCYILWGFSSDSTTEEVFEEWKEFFIKEC